METTDPMIKKKSTSATSNSLMLWKVLAIVFIVISIALLIALIVVATKQQKSDEHPDKSQANQTSHGAASVESCADGMTSSSKDQPKSAEVFDDLSVDEITAVRDYLLKQAALNLTEFDKATVASSYIYSIQLLPPSKDEVLDYLDNDGAKPERKSYCGRVSWRD
ncbi:amine oxidase [Desmophyllum pertusum]|uniref:Amine oxidase n=1 Tax=Desmophyllum pertusum TaxID=174260 RepID=A0A9X0A4Z1_9CNID|nr:amine oxidase [Desmophyllum pertusum]